MAGRLLRHGHSQGHGQDMIVEAPPAGLLNYTTPSPPHTHGPYTSPLRRNHLFSPSLSTSIATHVGSLQSTPLSAVSSSNPFTPLAASPGAGIAPALSRGQSPMAARSSAAAGVPYDPRDWASGDVNANQTARAREQHGEEGLASPPPPYSPAPFVTGSRQGIGGGGEEDIMPAQRIRTQSASRSLAPTVHHAQSMDGGSSAFSASRTTSNPLFASSGYQVPPPPPMGPSSRQSSQTRIPPREPLSAVPYDGSNMSVSQAVHAPTSRRAASANAGLQFSSDPGSSSRSNAQSDIWPGSAHLPGPPPGPPPASSRSQSASTSERALHRPEARYKSSRYSLQITDLGPIPPTPVGWTESLSLHQADQQSLGAAPDQAESTHHAQRESTLSSSNVGTATGMSLSRSSAVRDSSAQGLRERRALHRNSRCLATADTETLSVTTGLSMQVAEPGDILQIVPPSNNRTPRGQHLSLDTSTPPSSPSSRLPAVTRAASSSKKTARSLLTPPLSNGATNPFRQPSSLCQDSGSDVVRTESASFIDAATERFTEFIQREQSLSNDLERLHLFSSYILHEASIRAKLYHHIIGPSSFDIDSVRNSLFERPYHTADAQATNRSFQTDRQLPETETLTRQRQDANHRKEYEPALSPIASMDYDEMSSRGRAPSRWWESQSGSQSGGKAPRVQRSKRESKYMGLSKELLMSLSPESDMSVQFKYETSHHASSESVYPPEKSNPETFGYYDEVTPRTTSGFHSKSTEGPALLDISRFVTLPPPYPRHFPAVNNNHPKLTQYRTTVRTLSDLSEVYSRRSRHKSSSEALRGEHKRRLSDSRGAFKDNIQFQIREGSVSFTEAAEAEKVQQTGELDLERKFLQSEFDTLQDMVINPVHDLLHDRISKLDSSIEQLKGELRTDMHHQNPDGPQEEGDETPELLETLTQLKWLFDTREQMHKELYAVLTERNEKFKSIVLLPHLFHGNKDKIRDTEAFFEQDSETRQTKHSEAAVERHEVLLGTVDACVRRGVELQSSAFWDIAPGLLDVLQKIPEDLRQLPGIQIPAEELDENPSYHKHPHQYLYLLLSHAEKSTYQYIEGQTNLQCLLHEVKSGLLLARHRLRRTSNGSRAHAAELEQSREAADAALTAELKQKASMIEEQWLEALGSQLQGIRERVKLLLEETDAWEEIAQDDA